MEHLDDNEIAANLRVVISRLLKILRSKTNNDEALSLTEISTLALVYQYSEILPSKLATIEKVTNQSMSQIISKLFKSGFVKKTPSKKDKRKVIITITVAGKKSIDKRRLEKQEWLAESIYRKTSEKEKKILTNAIDILTKLVDLE